MLNLDDFKKAHKSISPYINYTPLIHSLALSKNLEVYLKLECLQVTGSFKLRGATNKLLSLTNEQKNKGVIAVSTGNHGKGVAHAAKQIGIKSTIFMSSMVPEHRKKAIESLGAKVEIIGNNSDEADLYAREFAKKNNITLVHPFDDLDVIAGQGTVGLEMLEAMPDIDSVIIPTSGGGLIGGIALAIKLQKPNVKIIATSMKRGPSMYESLKAGKPVDVKEEETLADCLGGSIGLENQYTFGICKDVIDDFILIDEPKIAEGIKFNFEKHKLVTEGAAATSIMAVKDQLSSHFGKNTICLLCGGNIDSELFGKIIS
jgi:threonine dehydratase|tara:strand:+ start:3042 stop:3992 length:951 start_codon:yes stop_codon:yes gene_type:complete